MTYPNWRRKSFTDNMMELIEEVKKQPIIWDKSKRAHRRKVAREWDAIASTLQMKSSDIKSKWRNLKDTFHREAKKVEMTNAQPGDSIIDNYGGQWIFFEKLMFLWDDDRHLKRTNDEVLIPNNNTQGGSNASENAHGKIRERLASTASEEAISESEEEFKPEIDQESTHEIMIVDNSATSFRNVNADPIAEERVMKRALNYNHQRIEKKKRYDTSDADNKEIDEDLHFAKSLVPFMRRLTPIRKLIVRNEIHGLLLKELLCERCKSNGPQARCRCNFDL